MQKLCVFCGSSTGTNAIYADAARKLGSLLAARKLGLVYGGGHVGLMGVLADAVLAAGGEVVGVIPQALLDKELAHSSLSQLHVVATMHQRKALMADLADGFLALPGAYGTADELFEILTWAQLGLHQKPIGLLNANRFFDPLMAWLDRAVEEGFLKAKHRRLLLESADLDELLGRMRSFHPGTPVAKWIDRPDR